MADACAKYVSGGADFCVGGDLEEGVAERAAQAYKQAHDHWREHDEANVQRNADGSRRLLCPVIVSVPETDFMTFPSSDGSSDFVFRRDDPRLGREIKYYEGRPRTSLNDGPAYAFTKPKCECETFDSDDLLKMTQEELAVVFEAYNHQDREEIVIRPPGGVAFLMIRHPEGIEVTPLTHGLPRYAPRKARSVKSANKQG